jgi:ectoine hydroxylase-related dioxygenase (phytanoyl-CoA dioxygenase family)
MAGLDFSFDPYEEAEILHEHGISALHGAYDRSLGWKLASDVAAERNEAVEAGATKDRGPNRVWYPLRPECVSAFIYLAMHPYVQEVSEAVLGPDYQIVEFGVDEPGPGAADQPWHRDVPLIDDVKASNRFDCLVFNTSLVDVTPAMGPFEIAPGTQFLDDPDVWMWRGRFVFRRFYEKLFARDKVQQRMGLLGDIQVRSPLTLHRGTANTSGESRPVLLLGVCASTSDTPMHSLPVSERWLESLAPTQQDFMERHVRHQVVEQLGPVTTPGTDVEELMEGRENEIPF